MNIDFHYFECSMHSSGVSKYRLCSLAQYINLVGVTIGYTITTAISMGYYCMHSPGLPCLMLCFCFCFFHSMHV
jgi:hypothetical protein